MVTNRTRLGFGPAAKPSGYCALVLGDPIVKFAHKRIFSVPAPTLEMGIVLANTISVARGA